MRFQCELRYTYQDLLALDRLTCKLYRRVWSTLLRALCIVLGLFLLACFLLSVLLLRDPVTELLVPGVVGLLLLLVGLFSHQLNALQSRWMLVRGAEEGRFMLDEEGFHEESAKGTGFHPYDAFLEIVDWRGRYFFYLDRRHAYVLPYSSFTAGEPAALASFLEQQRGRPVRSVR